MDSEGLNLVPDLLELWNEDAIDVVNGIYTSMDVWLSVAEITTR